MCEDDYSHAIEHYDGNVPSCTTGCPRYRPTLNVFESPRCFETGQSDVTEVPGYPCSDAYKTCLTAIMDMNASFSFAVKMTEAECWGEDECAYTMAELGHAFDDANVVCSSPWMLPWVYYVAFSILGMCVGVSVCRRERHT